MNRQSSLYHTKTKISIDIKISDKDDYYYIYMNDIFLKRFKSKTRVYNYLRYTFGITIMI